MKSLSKRQKNFLNRILRNALIVKLLAVVVLPLLFMSTWVTYQIHRTLSSNTERLSIALDLKAKVNDLLPLLLMQDDATKAMLLDPSTLEKYSEKKIDAYDRHQKLLEEISGKSIKNDVKGIVKRLQEVDGNFLRPIDSSILEALFEDIEKARQGYFQNYEPHRSEYEQELRKLIEMVGQEANAMTLIILEENEVLTRNVILALIFGPGIITIMIFALARMLNRSKENTQILLSSLNEGLFFFDASGRIAPERTNALDKIVPGSSRLASLGEICQLVAGTRKETVDTCLNLLWADPKDDFFSDFSTSVSLLPRRVDFNWNGDIRVLNFEYRPQYGEASKLVRVIVTVSDISEKLALESNAARQAERIRRLSKAAASIESFHEFMKEVITIFRRVDQEYAKGPNERNDPQLKRDLHTLKGTLATFEFAGLADDFHELETLHEEQQHEGMDSKIRQKWDFIKDRWKFESTDIVQVLGLDKQNGHISVMAATYQQLLRKSLHEGTRSLASSLMMIRCFPLQQVFARYEDYIARLCERRGNKSIRFQYQSDSDDIAFEQIQDLDAALVHIFRNCMDHGIESTEERKKAGKDRQGEIRISVYRTRSGYLHMVIKDDGAGINTDKLVQKALTNGLWTREQAHGASHMEKLNLIFASGLSTAEAVTDTSGRGVGMDAVKTMVESLGGKISVYSERDAGTQFEIDVPLASPWNLLAEPEYASQGHSKYSA